LSALLARIEAFRHSGDPSPLIGAIPYAQFLGLSMQVSAGELRGKLSFADHLVGNPALPALHGGTTGALLESTAIFELLWSADTVVLPKTISITIQYLRSGRPLDTFARGVITKRGRRVVTVRAEAWQKEPDRPIATATASFLVLPGGPAANARAPA